MKNGLRENVYGDKHWYKEGKLHREDGPAIEYASGTKLWFYEGQCHRENGPAAEYPNGFKEWYINHKKIYCSSQEEFEKFMKLKVFW